VRVLILKAGTTVLAIAATAASAMFVTSHLKNPAAPLQPPVLNANGNASSVSSVNGTVTVGPSVQPGHTQPVTSTYAS
jgi:hypothetical protein